MQNKKVFISLGVAIIVVGAAAFIAGSLLNQKVGPAGLNGQGGRVLNLVPAPELPTTEPEATGRFEERQDNVIVISTFSLRMGGGGVAADPVGRSASEDDLGPKVEILITSETAIYRDTTQFPSPSDSKVDQAIQQTAEEATLDDLGSSSIVTVWGRKSGDRIIAEVLFFFTPTSFGPAPE
ncbi:MAG: hypothetical protein HYU84_14620 [Chloroflexi bacterium]|nr:hypothetical protein [Chloroflexota bacterium]MBI3168899.1 hypothetical protein [Chloroflexota bacterium]